MNRRLLRLALVAVLGVMVVAVVRMLRGDPVPAFESAGTDPVPWPPLPRKDAPAPDAVPAPVVPTPIETGLEVEVAWIAPGADGAVPATHPVKAKMASGIFHVPGGVSYERTRPDRCYRTAADAEADGLRAAHR